MSGNSRSGRRPLPSAVKEAMGNPGHRALNEYEPKPREMAPPPSDIVNLVPVALEERERMLAEMRLVPGWISPTDRAVLDGYAYWYSVWQAASAAVVQHGLTYETVFIDGAGQEHKKIIARPELKIAKDAYQLMLKSAIETGFTAAARSRIVARPPETEDDDDLDFS